MMLTTTASSGPSSCARPRATMFKPSVVPRVNTTHDESAAPTKRATVSRARSSASVEACAR